MEKKDCIIVVKGQTGNVGVNSVRAGVVHQRDIQCGGGHTAEVGRARVRPQGADLFDLK